MRTTKWSPIWRMPSDEFSQLVARSKSAAEVLRQFGFNGSNAPTLKRRIQTDNLSTSHFVMTPPPTQKAFPLESVLVEGSSYSRCNLKRRLIREGRLKEECFKCGCGTSWCGEPLVLILDHINGVNNDHRLENLRLVCPNCNSQLPTFAGRNVRSKTRGHYCMDCGKELSVKSSQRCRGCSSVQKGAVRRKINWPTYEVLQQRIAQSNRNSVSRELGVSETAVRKMLKRMARSK